MISEPSRLLVALVVIATVFGGLLGGFLFIMLWLAVCDKEEANAESA